MDNYYSSRDILDRAIGTDAYFQIKYILTSTKAADAARAQVQWAMEMPEAVVHCRDCRELMFSDCYGECRRGYLGIVRQEDYCSHGVRKETQQDDSGGEVGLGAPLPAGDGGPIRVSDGGGADPADGAGTPDQKDGAGCCIRDTEERRMN